MSSLDVMPHGGTPSFVSTIKDFPLLATAGLDACLEASVDALTTVTSATLALYLRSCLRAPVLNSHVYLLCCQSPF